MLSPVRRRTANQEHNNVKCARSSQEVRNATNVPLLVSLVAGIELLGTQSSGLLPSI